jgi:FtsP/CotA-like multicopper oxidase with cupredoxin domain
MAGATSRRSFLAAGGACAGAAFLKSRGSSFLSVQEPPRADAIKLAATMRTLEINGRPATLMGLEQGNGKQGLTLSATHPFDVLLENKLPVPTSIHWHGLHPPNSQDGVPGLTQRAVLPNTSDRYYFPLKPTGTHWMHSHLGLQEAFLLSAPLIVHGREDEAGNEHEIVLFLGDFSFIPPAEIYSTLRKPATGMMAMAAGKSKTMAMKADVNDVNYDAYLANDRTLADPDVIRVEEQRQIRLRIINGSSGTNFFVSLEGLQGELIATDGMPVRPVKGSQFPVAIAQRIDIRLQIPAKGAYPILALREGATEQTGVLLATAGAVIRKLPVQSAKPANLLNLALERQLTAVQPLATKAIDQSFDLRLQGNMARYEWTINGIVFDTANPGSQKAQVRVKEGQRIALRFVNDTGMSHPMHLHGHSFQVIAINGQPMNGALRDTILVPGKTSVTVAFDADNPGTWYVHCHVLWHLAAGMATLVQYEA